MEGAAELLFATWAPPGGQVTCYIGELPSKVGVSPVDPSGSEQLLQPLGFQTSFTMKHQSTVCLSELNPLITRSDRPLTFTYLHGCLWRHMFKGKKEWHKVRTGVVEQTT